MIKKIALIPACAALLCACIFSPAYGSDGTGILRVCVLKDAGTAVLSIKGNYKILTLKTGEFLKKGSDLKNVTVLPSIAGVSIGGEPFTVYGVNITAAKGSVIYIDKHSFRGSIDIIRTEKKKLLAVNHIGVEDYLKGVLYHEVSHWWPMEALKAQAIAARTYALYQKSISFDKDYDLTNDIYSQVYGGKASERLKTSRAVDATRAEVLTYKGKIFPAYYHATCGGHTEDASSIWDTDLPPLKGVKCNFCRLSPHYKWKYNIGAPELQRKLISYGYDAKGLKGLRVSGKTSSGRVRDVIAVCGKTTKIPASIFRLAIGPNLIRSTNFTLKQDGERFMFYGKGWGHGVGMCQWGAFFLSLKRYNAERILKFYYPGAKISKIKSY